MTCWGSGNPDGFAGTYAADGVFCGDRRAGESRGGVQGTAENGDGGMRKSHGKKAADATTATYTALGRKGILRVVYTFIKG